MWVTDLQGYWKHVSLYSFVNSYEFYLTLELLRNYFPLWGRAFNGDCINRETSNSGTLRHTSVDTERYKGRFKVLSWIKLWSISTFIQLDACTKHPQAGTAKWAVLPGSHGCLLAGRQSKLDTSVCFCDGDGRKVWQDLYANIDLTLNANLRIKEAPEYSSQPKCVSQ